MRVWQVLACLTVLSFLCRSVIPAGYMPDVSGGHGGKLSITFCTTGGGSGTLLMDLDDQPDQPSPDNHAGNQDCPFGVVASQAVMPSQQAHPLTTAIAYHPIPALHRNQAQPPLPAVGPPLGSRAPPSNLG